MSKIIKLTDDFKNECIREFVEAINSAKLSDGKMSFTKTFDHKENKKATIYYTSKAWAKMIVLLNEFNKEVAWHGVAKRIGEDNEHKFLISDILVYPQKVTGVTVNTDQVEYQNWLMGLDDETFNNLRMQGHSHVNMQTSPSAVDLSHQEKILEQLEDDMFYIFMIWNKRYERTIKIYDLKNNILFENKDIDVRGADEEDSIFEFLSNAKKTVVDNASNSYYQKGSYSGGYGSYDYNKPKKEEPLKTEAKEDDKKDAKSDDKADKSKASSKPITRVYDKDYYYDKKYRYY